MAKDVEENKWKWVVLQDVVVGADEDNMTHAETVEFALCKTEEHALLIKQAIEFMQKNYMDFDVVSVKEWFEE